MILLAGILRAEIIGSERKTSTLPVADVIDAWRPREEGPCAHCGARTCVYGPRGNPPCADCRSPGTGTTVLPAPVARMPNEREMAPGAARAIRRGAA